MVLVSNEILNGSRECSSKEGSDEKIDGVSSKYFLGKRVKGEVINFREKKNKKKNSKKKTNSNRKNGCKSIGRIFFGKGKISRFISSDKQNVLGQNRVLKKEKKLEVEFTS